MTILQTAMDTMDLDAAGLAKAIGSHPTNCYRLRAGRMPAGPSVRARISRAVGRPEQELFDAQGWPLEAPSHD